MFFTNKYSAANATLSFDGCVSTEIDNISPYRVLLNIKFNGKLAHCNYLFPEETGQDFCSSIENG